MVVDNVIHFTRGVSSFVRFFYMRACMHARACRLFVTLWTSPSFSVHGIFYRQEQWSGLPFPPPDFPCLFHWQADSSPLSHLGSLVVFFNHPKMCPPYSDSNSNIMTQNSTLFLVLSSHSSILWPRSAILISLTFSVIFVFNVFYLHFI